MNVYNCQVHSHYPEFSQVTNYHLWPRSRLKAGQHSSNQAYLFFTQNMHVKVVFYYLHVVSEQQVTEILYRYMPKCCLILECLL